jgi:coniferyl-aldehyde dehydrogenase
MVPTLNEIRHAISNLRKWMEARPVPVSWQFWPATARVEYQPLGVVGILAAWNYPLFLSIAPAAGALAAGNRVILKPSELAPQTADLLRTIVAEHFPPEVLTVITGGHEIAAELSQLPFDHILYTGSARAGKLVMQAAAENLTPVTLELGGKCPAIVHKTYSMRRAAERILAGKLYNAGQTCVAPDYVLIPDYSRDIFLQRACDVAAAMYPKLVANPDYTRIINDNHYQRLTALIEEARQAGAEIVELNPASEDCNAANRVFPPTLVIDPPAGLGLMDEEIFGPILPIISYRELDDAIRYVNDRPRPLALYYFDESGQRVTDVMRRTVSGGAAINDCVLHVAQPNLPFGGVGPSGMGHYHGFDGFETLSKKKGVFVQGRWSSLGLLRPPYGKLARRMLKTIVGG